MSSEIKLGFPRQDSGEEERMAALEEGEERDFC